MEYVVGYMTTVVAFDLYQHIPGIKHSRRLDALITAHFNDSLSWHQDFSDLALQIRIANACLQTVTHFFLVSRVRMKYEPLLHLNLPQPSPKNLAIFSRSQSRPRINRD